MTIGKSLFFCVCRYNSNLCNHSAYLTTGRFDDRFTAKPPYHPHQSQCQEADQVLAANDCYPSDEKKMAFCVIVTCRRALEHEIDWNSYSTRQKILTRIGIFGLAVSVWAVSVWAFSVWPIRSGRFGHGTFRSDCEILQKSYFNAKTSRLIQSALPPSSYCRLPKVEAFNSKLTPFTIRNSGKRCRQGILLGTKFLVVLRSNWTSGVSGLARVFDNDLWYCKMQAWLLCIFVAPHISLII